MKVLFVGLARSIWLFDVKLMNPRGISLQGVIDGLRDRYSFGQAPKHSGDVGTDNALAFKSGTFVNSKGVPILVSFSIFNDGFVADTLSSTDDSTEFLTTVTRWIQDEYGLSIPTEIKKVYVSQIDCECDTPMSALNPHLPEIAGFLDRNVRSADDKTRHFNVSGLSLWTEDNTKPLAPAAFKYERKIGAPFSANHYFSQAPLETQAHIELLNRIERVLRG